MLLLVCVLTLDSWAPPPLPVMLTVRCSGCGCSMLGAIPMALGTIVQGLVLSVGRAYGQWAITLAWVLWWTEASKAHAAL